LQFLFFKIPGKNSEFGIDTAIHSIYHLFSLFLSIVKTPEIKKIVIVGPESTGKSTLCEQLAQHYNTNWCPEFAREYLLTNGMNYTYSDLLKIAKGQLALEDEYVQSAPDSYRDSSQQPGSQSPLFIDTDMYVMKVWCEFVFGKCHAWITDQIAKRKYDLYLLCNTDLPWVKDELREYPDLETRDKLYHIYKNILSNQPVPWVDISGGYEERLQKAVNAVDAVLKS
jgi:NadR type nicotinamide-nucleotide adenylyltransferase